MLILTFIQLHNPQIYMNFSSVISNSACDYYNYLLIIFTLYFWTTLKFYQAFFLNI